MAGMNIVCITGNLGKDPDIRSTASGTTIMQFSLAVNERRKVNDEWTDYTHWIPCVVIGSRAESLSRILHKGSKVGITGRLSYSSWKNESGENRSKIEVKVSEVELLSPRKDGAENVSQSRGDMGNVAAEQETGAMGLYEGEIPF